MAKKKQTTRLTSFAEMFPAVVDVIIDYDDDKEFVVQLRTLSHAQWERIGTEVPNPTPTVIGGGKDGKVVYDYNDAGYQQKFLAAQSQRTYRRLLASMVMDVPGKTTDEQIEYLTSLDVNLLNQLIQAINELATRGRARVEARSSTFSGT